jgi:hypothetical protein
MICSFHFVKEQIINEIRTPKQKMYENISKTMVITFKATILLIDQTLSLRPFMFKFFLFTNGKF